MELKRSGSQPSAQGPAEYFTGTIENEAEVNSRLFLSGAECTTGFAPRLHAPVECDRP